MQGRVELEGIGVGGGEGSWAASLPAVHSASTNRPSSPRTAHYTPCSNSPVPHSRTHFDMSIASLTTEGWRSRDRPCMPSTFISCRAAAGLEGVVAGQ